VRESGSSGGYLRVFSYRGVFCKSVEVQGFSEVSLFFFPKGLFDKRFMANGIGSGLFTLGTNVSTLRQCKCRALVNHT
jgi:hypothetical protein